MPRRNTALVASANLELVRSIMAAWERGEILPTASIAELVDPDIEIVVVDGPEPSSRKGLAAAAPGVEVFLGLWEHYRVEAEGYLELDAERVLVFSRVIGRGKSSGVEIEQRRAGTFQIRDGKIRRLVMWWDRDRALADLGLAPGSDAGQPSG
jgi:ketosteroid isomerase-like protein